MTFPAAKAALSRVGSSRATGDTLRAMYAQLVTDCHGGDPVRYFGHLAAPSDADVTAKAKSLLADRAKAWDVLMGLPV